MEIAPPHPFAEQDAAYLASPDDDSTLSGSSGEGV